VDYPPPVQNLINQLARLPSLGKRSAERIALHLLKHDPTVSRQLADAILQTKSRIHNCARCGSYTEADPCEICSSARRDQHLICVVEGPNDILMLERAGAHRGVYHALMGRISPLNGIGPEQLRLAALVERVKNEKPTEVIIALSADVESDATAHYIADLLKSLPVAVSRIGMGLSVGSSVELADEVTLSRAMDGRRKF
jgi:recombination protein RecR